MMIQHNKKPKPRRGNKICPDCYLESGTRTQGQCKGTTADGTACTHDWGRTIPKKDREIARLKAELDRASSGHGGSSSSSGGAASTQISNLQDEITRLENKNVQLMAENNRLRQDALHGDNFLDNLDSGLDDPLPSLSRKNSLTPVSPRGAAPSLNRENSLRSSSLDAASCDSTDFDDVLRLLTDPVPPSSSETAPQNDVLAEMADVLFKLSKLTHDQQKAALNQIHLTLNYALTPDTHGPAVNPNR